MSRSGSALGLALALAACAPATADDVMRAVETDVFTSSDADHTEVTRAGLSLDWRYRDRDHYDGVRLESARFRPLGQETTHDLRAYYRFADSSKGWAWRGQVGTDGETVLGGFSVHDAGYRTEYFLEREIVETPQGIARGVYYTFAGAAVDLPLDARNSLSLVGAGQAFTGRNVRAHLRANYIHVVNPDWGLTAQVRARYFRSSHPGEFDYFSPRDHAQVIPTLQLRRRHAGWRYTLAAGLGAQRQTGGAWRQARTLSAKVTSPPLGKGWSIDAAFDYSNTATGAGYAYDYRQFGVNLTRAF